MPRGSALASGRGDTEDYKLVRYRLRIGQRMPCHAFTRYGVLLLARGEVVATPTQLDRLLYPDIIFSNEPPPRLLPIIRKRQAALGIIEEDRADDEVAEEIKESPVEEALVTQPMDFEEPPPLVPFAEEIDSARSLHQETTYHVADLLAQVRAGRPLDLRETTRSVDRVLQSLQRNERAFASLLRLKDMDSYTFTHSIDTCVFSLLIARSSGTTKKLSAIGVGALLHDIGKTLVPVHLLRKVGPLTPSEWKLIQQHSISGTNLVKQSRGHLPEHIDAIAQHHERLDGSGYPLQLLGDQVSLIGRIVAIADVYDAMTSDRPYRASLGPPAAMRWIISQASKLFDLELVRAFIARVGIFPVGSLARLSTGELAVVIKVNAQALFKPIILAVSDANGMPLLKPSLINMAMPPFANTREIMNLEDPHAFDINVDEYLAAVPEEKIVELKERASDPETNLFPQSTFNKFA